MTGITNKYRLITLIFCVLVIFVSLACTYDAKRDNPNDNGATGVLTYMDSYSNAIIDGAWSVAVSPDGKNVYVAAYNADAVAWFRRDSTGALTYVNHYSNTNIDGACSVAVSPDGKNVYVGAHEARIVAWFSRDTGTGALTYMDRSGDGALHADSITVSHDGKHVYVTGQGIVRFMRDSVTGSLNSLNRNPTDPDVDIYSVEISPDGNNLYFTKFNFLNVGYVYQYRRESISGTLNYVDVYVNADIDRARSVVVSHDGKNVYVAAYNSDAVAWFSRDIGTGALTYVNRYSNANIDGSWAVAISPDGKNVYVVAYYANAVAWFNRDSGTGALTYVNRYSNTIGGARSVAISPDGKNVYVAAEAANAVAWFSRDR